MKNTSAAVNETEGRTAYLGRRGWSEPDAHIYTPLKTEAGKSVLAKGDRRTFADTASKKDKPVVPLFFATDDNYLPFLGVTLCSLKENSSKDYLYKVYVLHSGVSENYYERSRFRRVSRSPCRCRCRRRYLLPAHARPLHLHHVFPHLSGMFPPDKALYLDCDTCFGISARFIVRSGRQPDRRRLRRREQLEVYKKYVSEVDGLDPSMFFNAGVILMNLKSFREENFYERFADLLKKYKFTVIQDEDYLNVLCQDRVLRLPRAWNKFPVAKDKLAREDLRIVHYGMTWKPWHYSDIPYQEYFWEYAEKTEFYGLLKEIFDKFSFADMERDMKCEAGLQALARSEIERPDNYFTVYKKQYGRMK
ncbi:MAG: glycosyltransferase family 8 protein [Christensenellaceae bacterium]